MKMLTKLLQACIAIEILGAAFFVVVWLRDPVPPRSNLAHYHPATADEIRSLEETVRDSGAAENWLTLGKAYLAAGFFPHGEYCCEQAARDADSDDAASFETLYWWGVALNQLGDTSQAIERFRQALPFADDHTSVNDAPARCWYGIGGRRTRPMRKRPFEKRATICRPAVSSSGSSCVQIVAARPSQSWTNWFRAIPTRAPSINCGLERANRRATLLEPLTTGPMLNVHRTACARTRSSRNCSMSSEPSG